MKIKVKTEGLEGDALKFAVNLNEFLETMPESATKQDITDALDAFKLANTPATETPEEKTARETLEANAKKELDELKETVQWLKEAGNSSKSDPMADLKKQLKDNKDKLKSIAKSRNSSEELVIKADTVRASIATNNWNLQAGDIGQLGTIERSLYNICTKKQVKKGSHNGTYAYTDWDESTTVRGAEAVAEGVTFNESTAKFKGYTIPLQKIGDILPVTEEFFEDEELAASELNSFLVINVDSVVNTELITGDNTGSHLKGLMSSTPAFTAVASGILNANVYDLIVKMKTAISTTRGSKYKQFNAVMNQDTADKLVLAKDLNGNYQFPTNHPIWSMIVIDNNMANDAMVVGDFRFAQILEMGGVALTSGYGATTGTFEDDMMLLKARKRLAFLIRTVDQTGFLKTTTVTADIATIQGV